jgi:hypothetical protein
MIAYKVIHRGTVIPRKKPTVSSRHVKGWKSRQLLDREVQLRSRLCCLRSNMGMNVI